LTYYTPEYKTKDADILGSIPSNSSARGSAWRSRRNLLLVHGQLFGLMDLPISCFSFPFTQEKNTIIHISNRHEYNIYMITSILRVLSEFSMISAISLDLVLPPFQIISHSNFF
jgi:hypothetical protein